MLETVNAVDEHVAVVIRRHGHLSAVEHSRRHESVPRAGKL
jgi:hypothetical protein